jgi:predicted nucleic acid-binding protein
MPDGIYRRSRIVQEQLTAKGEHRSAGPVDLLVAAAAEEAGLTLLHYDRDFETPHDRSAGPHDRPQAVEPARRRRTSSF